MTTATVPTQFIPKVDPGNLKEIGKFLLISIVWLGIIFGLVWLGCWAVGVLLPNLLLQLVPGNDAIVWTARILQFITPLVGVLIFIPTNATYMVLMERRGLALFTVRKGPNRVGPDGFLQTGADAVKLLFKENINPTGADILMFTLAPIIFFAPSVFAAVPLLAAVTCNHPLFSVLSFHTGIFYVLAMSSIPVVGIVMGGWASNNKYSLVGGLRSAAQAISYEIPLVLSIITICLLVNTLDVVQIVHNQAGPVALDGLNTLLSAHGDALSNSASALEVAHRNGGFPYWNLFGSGAIMASIQTANPVRFVFAMLLALSTIMLFWLYATGACAEINRIPFDLPEAESELVSGYNTEYSGIRFAIFFLAEFTNLFIVSSIATIIWLGGGNSPIPSTPEIALFEVASNILNSIVVGVAGALGASADGAKNFAIASPVVMCGVFWALFKTYALIFFAILIRGTLPRFRIDQLMDFGWKRLIPLALILLLAVTYLKELV